jgi:hypothetical protein
MFNLILSKHHLLVTPKIKLDYEARRTPRFSTGGISADERQRCNQRIILQENVQTILRLLPPVPGGYQYCCKVLKSEL